MYEKIVGSNYEAIYIPIWFYSIIFHLACLPEKVADLHSNLVLFYLDPAFHPLTDCLIYIPIWFYSILVELSTNLMS